MEFKEAIRIWRRMCKVCGHECKICSFEEFCSDGFKYYPDEVEATLTEWAAEHPEKTRMDDFFEKHPKAPSSENGAPLGCAKHSGYVAPGTQCATSCFDCWCMPLEEVEE